MKKTKSPEKERRNAKIMLFATGGVILIAILYIIIMMIVNKVHQTKDDGYHKVVDCVLTKEPGQKDTYLRDDLTKLLKMQNFYYMLVPERDNVQTTDNLLYEKVSDTQYLIIGKNLEFQDFATEISKLLGIQKDKTVVLDQQEGYYGEEYVAYYSLQAPYEGQNLYIFIYAVTTYIDDTTKEVYSTEYVATVTTKEEKIEDTYSLLNEMFNSRVDSTTVEDRFNELQEEISNSQDAQATPEPVIKDNIADASSYDEHVINASGEDIGIQTPKYVVEIDLEKDFPYALNDDENWNCLYARLDGTSDMYVDAIKLENESGDIKITNYDQIWDNEDLSQTRGMVMINISDIKEKSGKWTLTIYSRTDITNVNLGRMPLSFVDTLIRKGFSALDGPTQEEIENEENFEESEYEN